MKEVKSPKKPLIYYYGVVLLVLLVFNLVITPLLLKQEVTEVDYGTFMSMTESKNIGQVQVEDQQIVFTDKDEKNVYQTNVMDDPNLTERLYESGAKFSKDVDASTSPARRPPGTLAQMRPLRTSTSAPMDTKPFTCWSMGRPPRSQPPGRGTSAQPKRPSRAPTR